MKLWTTTPRTDGGDLLLRVRHRQSGAHVDVREPRTQLQRLSRARGALQAIQEKGEQRRERTSLRRQGKRRASGKVAKRVTHEHPVEEVVAACSEVSDVEEAAVTREQRAMAEVERARQVFAVEGPHNLVVPLRIAGRDLTAVVDTGAAASICPASLATELGLRFSGRSQMFRSFDGGLTEGRESLPIHADVGGYDIELSLWVVEKPTSSILVGRPDLARRDLVVLVKEGRLAARTELPILTVEAEDVGMARQPSVAFGHEVGLQGLKPAAKKVAAIRSAASPRNRKQLRAFFGLASRLTSPRKQWEWGRIAHVRGEDNVVADFLSRCLPRLDEGVDDAEIDGMAVPLFSVV